jgi:hypothetical protein
LLGKEYRLRADHLKGEHRFGFKVGMFMKEVLTLGLFGP